MAPKPSARESVFVFSNVVYNPDKSIVVNAQIYIPRVVRCTNLISPRSAHGAVGLPRRWSFLAITPSPMRWFNDRLRLRR